MSDVGDICDTLVDDHQQDAIEEAQAAGDDAEAQRLYRIQQGVEDPFGLEPLPEVPAKAPDDTNADGSASLPDIGPRPDGEWTFDRPDVVNHQFAVMEAAFGDLATELRSEWGADAGTNLMFGAYAAREFEKHFPEVIQTIENRGAGDDPLIVEILAVLGRQWAETPGDPRTVRLFPNGQGMEKSMTNTGNVQAQIDALEDQIDQATAQNDSIKAQELYTQQQGLYRQLPGGTDSIVGRGGRNL